MASKKMLVVDPEKIKWEPHEQFLKGAWAKVLRIDEETGCQGLAR